MELKTWGLGPSAGPGGRYGVGWGGSLMGIRRLGIEYLFMDTSIVEYIHIYI